METVFDIIGQHPFVEELDPTQVEKLAMLATERSFLKDQLIFREGEQGRHFYVIVSGKVALEIKAPRGVLRIQTLEAGDELGWSSVLETGGRHFQARCLSPVRALAFDGGQLQRACREDPGFGYALMCRLLCVVSERLQATRLQLLDVYGPH
jgi:CRP-like cAMP-binding protein